MFYLEQTDFSLTARETCNWDVYHGSLREN